MWNRVAFAVVVGSMLFVRSAQASDQDRSVTPVTPAYANVEVVSIDPVTRLAVIKNSKGTEETFEFDDSVAGAAGMKPGDRVMMTVRGEPGRKRISAITKVTEGSAKVTVTSSSVPASRPQDSDLARGEVREHFANQVASLSQQARAIDSVWGSFVTSCNAKPASSSEGGRDWFGLWDGRVKGDLSSGFCRDLFNQLITSGEGIKKAMASAEDVARKTMDAGEVRDICRLNSMDWDGWELPAPDKLQP
jgi:hypothetical protein